MNTRILGIMLAEAKILLDAVLDGHPEDELASEIYEWLEQYEQELG